MTPPRRCWRFGRRRDLVERLAPFVQPIDPAPVRLVSVQPIRWWLDGWAAATGDPPEVIARGFGLDGSVIDALMAGRLRRVTPTQRRRICTALGLDPGIHE